MKKGGKIGFELSEDDYKNAVLIKPNFDIKELFNQKGHLDYLKEFLLTKSNYQTAINAVSDAKVKSMPTGIKVGCEFCNGDSENELDKKCSRYYSQMDITFTFASSAFINIVLKEKLIYNNKKQLFQLTINFFNCLRFIKGKGLMYFDLEQMSRYVLNAGFMSLADVFYKSEILNNLRIINDNLDYLEQKEIENELLQKEDDCFLNLQIKFFEKKQKYYSAKVFIEEKSKILIKSKPKQKDKNTYSLKAVKIAYFCLGKIIDEKNYKELIKKYTNSTSAKILQKPIFKSSQLISLTENKTADKKHLNALNNAERLLSGIKNEKAIKSIKQFISKFESNFNEFYN